MGCGASRDEGSGALGTAEPSLKVPEADSLEDEEAQAEALKAIHEAITSAGLTAPALGPPEVPPPEQFTPLLKLPGCLTDLHDGMPPAVQQTPMRLLRIAVLSSWTKLKVYEEVDVETEALEVPYSRTDDDLWRRVATVSWRWGAPKPAEQQPGFSPMLDEQFQELKALLRVAERHGIELLWIDWSCVPQYSHDSMVEVHRSKVYYARSRAMYVLPTFHPLPDEGPVRLILVKARRVLGQHAEEGSARCLVAAAVIDAILAKSMVAGRDYFGRVWTLAERMARYGRGEGLWQWLSLEAWLGMFVDAMLKSTEGKASSQIYKKMLGQRAARLLDAVLDPLAAAVRTGSILARAAEGLEIKVAELCKAAVGVWLSPSLLAEAPTSTWLHTYLGEEARSGVYQAFSEADRVWSIYSYFCWKSHRDRRSTEALKTALWDLVEIAAGDRHEYRAGMFAQLGIDGRTASEKRREEEEQRAIAEAAIAAAEQRKRDEEAQAEMERQRQADAAAAAVAAERRMKEMEAKAAEAERRMKEMEAQAAAAAERKRKEEAAAAAAAAERRMKEAEAKAAEAERRMKEAEAKAAEAEAARKRAAAEAAKQQAVYEITPRTMELLEMVRQGEQGRIRQLDATLADARGLVSLIQDGRDVRGQERATEALKNLAGNPDNCGTITEAGAIPPLIRLLGSYNDGVQMQASVALMALATFVPANRDTIAKAGAIPPLVRLLSSHNVGVLKGAASALYSLSSVPSNKAAMISGGAIPALKKLLSSYDTDVRRWAGDALQRLEG